MQVIALGDLATRLKNFFGLRGRIPSTMDETVVPVLIAGDATDSLFAQQPVTCQGLAVLTFSVTAGLGMIQNLTPNLVVKVDGVLASDNSAAATAQLLVADLARNQAVLTLGGLGTSVQLSLPPVVGANSLPGQSVISSGNGAGFPGVNGKAFSQFKVPAGGTIYVPMGVVLYPNDALIFQGPAVAAVSTSLVFYHRESVRI